MRLKSQNNVITNCIYCGEELERAKNFAFKASCFRCKRKNQTMRSQQSLTLKEIQDKIAGYWQAIAIATQEKDLGTLTRCNFALKALYKKLENHPDSEYMPVDTSVEGLI